jgi:Na+-transporting NADH:ubiquinone oxidoreductase subunit NqrB
VFEEVAHPGYLGGQDTLDALRFGRRAASFAGSAGSAGRQSMRECFSASIFFVIHLRSNWRAYDDLCTGKLDFARLFTILRSC